MKEVSKGFVAGLVGIVAVAVVVEAATIGYLVALQGARIERLSDRVNRLTENMATVSANLAGKAVDGTDGNVAPLKPGDSVAIDGPDLDARVKMGLNRMPDYMIVRDGGSSSLVSVANGKVGEVLIADVVAAGMDPTDAEYTTAITVDSHRGYVYVICYSMPGAGGIYSVDLNERRFTRLPFSGVQGRMPGPFVSETAGVFLKLEGGGEADTISVYDMAKGEVRKIGKLPAGYSYTKSVYPPNLMGEGLQAEGAFTWSDYDGKIHAEVYRVDGKLTYPGEDRKPVATVSLEPDQAVAKFDK